MLYECKSYLNKI